MTKNEIWPIMIAKQKEYKAQQTILDNITNLETYMNNSISNLGRAITYYNNSYELFTTRGYIGGFESRATLTKQHLEKTKDDLETLKVDLENKLSIVQAAKSQQSTATSNALGEWQSWQNEYNNAPDFISGGGGKPNLNMTR